MSEFDSDGGPENDWEDRGDLAWNEFDWERYLREQDEAVHRYLGFYEACKNSTDRIDDVAELMNWGNDASASSLENGDDDDADESPEFAEGDDVYTLHKNPIFISTKALYLGLRRHWELAAGDNRKVPQPLAIALLASLHRGEEQAVQAIHALDFGDYAMAVSLFKRALSALNGTLALLNDRSALGHKTVETYRENALPKLFDLREIWLRVVSECREELDRPVDGEN
ncbi:MAG TPA: hypothetical protein VG710_07435 [Opitutus sp.]|nr:hypothetical protein [Opitutus sp.]